MLFVRAFSMVAVLTFVLHEQAIAQDAPPPGYLDIPAGFDFPASKKLLEQYRSQPNVPAQRTHVWNVFAGITRPAPPNGKYAIFETWFSEEETFRDDGVAPVPRTLIPFKVPFQFDLLRGGPRAGVAGSAVLSSVLYNFAAYNHIRSNRLYLKSVLAGFAASGLPDPKIPQNRTIPVFPRDAVVLKTVWWPVAKDRVSTMPVWDPDGNPPRGMGNPKETWGRYVGIDPTRPAPSGEFADIDYDGKKRVGSHIVDLDSFHWVTLDQNAVAGINSDGLLKSVAQASFGRTLAIGDYAVLVATHLITKETDDWVWATFWWHDKPFDGSFALDRVASIGGVWRNYLMSASYDLNLPGEKDGSAHATFNPWLEAGFPDGGHGGGGVVSNCMNCHNRASSKTTSALPIYRGNPDLANDVAYGRGALRFDFLWSVWRRM